MPVCTFFGHSDCPRSVMPTVREVIVDLIERSGVDIFYVGNHGAFDGIVRAVLRELAPVYPHIRYAVVLAYMPQMRDDYSEQDYYDTMLPEGIESVAKRFAITWRNRWMLKQSDIVVSYITHSWGGAAQFVELARRQGKEVINIGDG